jgi:hypothetical protein
MINNNFFVNSNNRSVFIMEAHCVFYEVELDYSVACRVIRVPLMFGGGGGRREVDILGFIFFLKCFFFPIVFMKLQVYILFPVLNVMLCPTSSYSLRNIIYKLCHF